MNQTVNNMSLSIIRKFGTAALIMVICIVLLPDERALAMKGGSFQLIRSTVDGGGGTSTGGQYILRGTIAQHDAAYSEGEQYELLGGFWPGWPLCIVDFGDFAIFAQYWLETGVDLPPDLYKDEYDTVDYLDLDYFLHEWLNYCPYDWPLK